MKAIRKFISIAAASALISVGAATSALADDLPPVSTEANVTITISALVADFPDGGQLYTYDLPDGSVLSVPYPPEDFDPITATAQQLAQYDIEPRPIEAAALEAWNATYSDYDRPSEPSLRLRLPASGTLASTQYDSSWGGWEVGTINQTASTYVAIKANFVVPQISTSCNFYSTSSIWIGLGGDTYNANDLLQQGLTRCNFYDSSGIFPGWLPFTEFAAKQYPLPLCGSTAPVPVGHTVYQNMSYQRSTNTAYFYFDDQSVAGGALACHLTGPAGWSFNGATAEWIVEKSSSYFDDYGEVIWSNVTAETAADSIFHIISSQPHTKYQTGTAGALCQTTSNVTGNTNFTTTWVAPTCQ